MRNASGRSEKVFSSSGHHPTHQIHFFCSEANKHSYESDSEAVVDPKLAMYRLHEGVSHASRASDVGELHRLQKSSTKPRHDGEFLIDSMMEAKKEKKRASDRPSPFSNMLSGALLRR